MSSSWSRLSRPQQRTWSLIAGAIVAGSAFKVGYFNLTRAVMVDDSTRLHKDGLERLREAEEFAKWSKKDREARLPPLSPEQREQMRNYLQIVEQHGLSKGFEDTKQCVGCPVMHGKNVQADTSAA